jgi:ATP-dependent NAD(P)H-hydrate dehydratase
MRLGADLAHVICASDAANVIKTYSPDLIVHPIFRSESSHETVEEELKSIMSRLHVLVLGPGLGRQEPMQSYARLAVKLAREQDMYLVIDADGLWMVQQYPDTIKGYSKAVLTPNVVEFKRLCESQHIDPNAPQELLATLLAQSLGGVTILQKGTTDIIANEELVRHVDESGSLKRCGGQGDILSGLVGTFLAWGKAYAETDRAKDADQISKKEIPIHAAVGGATLTRTAAHFAFKRLGRGLLTSDIVGEIGHAYEVHFGEEGEKGWKGKF